MAIYVIDFIPKIFIIAIFTVTCLFSVVGNIYIILTVISSQYMKNATTIFMVSKSVSDLLTGCFMSLFTMMQTLNPKRVKGNACESPVFVELTCVASSIFSFMAVGVDRYLAVINPAYKYVRPKIILIFVAAVWIVSGCYSLRLIAQFEKTSNTTQCKMFFDEKEGGVLFRTIDFIFLFVVPAVVMGCMYIHIGMYLWRKESVTAHVLRKRKVVKFLVVTLLVFGLSWGPFYILDMNRSALYHGTAYVILRFLFVIMAICNSFMIPIIYILFFPAIPAQTKIAVAKALHLKNAQTELPNYSKNTTLEHMEARSATAKFLTRSRSLP